MRNALGYSLLEIMISLVVLSVGLLGLLGLQAMSVRFSHDSEVRSLVILQANAMADRMRANRIAVLAGGYDNLSGIPNLPNCATCTPTETMLRDLYEWNTANASLLPAGQGSVIKTGGVHNITIRWDNDKTGATGTACSGNSTVDLACYTLSIEL